jgi:hypothetical protein
MVSATKRATRGGDGVDFFATPPWCIDRLLDAIGDALPTDGTWLEPACGDGAIVDAVNDWYARRDREIAGWVFGDIAPRGRYERLPPLDYLSERYAAPDERYAIGITNPPFARAMDFVQRMTAECEVTIVLVRLNWLASAERAPWLREHAPSVFVLPNRPCFTGDGRTDATEYAWAAWGLESAPVLRILETTPVEERRGGKEAAE